MKSNSKIKVECNVNQTIQKVWDCWTLDEHIIGWYFASDDWYAPSSKNDLRAGGKFSIRMEAKDKSFGFDMEGEYTKVEKLREIVYKMADNREVSIQFIDEGGTTKVIEIFDPESENSIEMQQNGWQAILNNFKAYVERLD